MNIQNLRMKQIKKLRELYLEPGVLNTEAYMLVLNRKYSDDKRERVFKYLDMQEDKNIMSKKLYTVTTLDTLDEYKNIEELIIPDSIIYVDGNIAGFACPIVYNHKNLGVLINNPNVPLETKLSYIKQMGDIIDKVERVEYPNNKFQFGDLNEYNFIIDKDNKVKAIDLDSAYLGIGEPLNMAYYLLKNKYIKSIPEKYKATKKGIVIPSNNTDLYCYNMIILNALSKNNLHRVDIQTFYEYLDYIKDLNLPSDLIESINNIYIPKDNINPKDCLEYIDNSLEEKLEFKTFQKIK